MIQRNGALGNGAAQFATGYTSSANIVEDYKRPYKRSYNTVIMTQATVVAVPVRLPRDSVASQVKNTEKIGLWCFHPLTVSQWNVRDRLFNGNSPAIGRRKRFAFVRFDMPI